MIHISCYTTRLNPYYIFNFKYTSIEDDQESSNQGNKRTGGRVDKGLF